MLLILHRENTTKNLDVIMRSVRQRVFCTAESTLGFALVKYNSDIYTYTFIGLLIGQLYNIFGVFLVLSSYMVLMNLSNVIDLVVMDFFH